MMACQDSMFPTALPGVTSWNYAPVGGDITLTAEGMPIQPKVWQKLETLNGYMIMPWAVATHICSYPCFYSKSATAGATNHGRCQLWGQSKEKVGTTFCSGYPYHEPEYPLMIIINPCKPYLTRVSTEGQWVQGSSGAEAA
jgi:hypothetical protein